MMFDNVRQSVLIFKEPCDMRKSINGLSQLVASDYGCNPTDGRRYVFTNKSRTKLKLLYWHKNGFCLWQQRLEEERCTIPEIKESFIEITMEELQWLISGIDISKVKGFSTLKYDIFY